MSDKRDSAGELEARELHKSLERRTVIEALSLQVRPGEAIGLIGPNGAGKSTLFRIVMGVLQPDTGRVFYRGKDITREPTYRRARGGLGYLPQEVSVFSGLTVEENVRAVLELRAASPALVPRPGDTESAANADPSPPTVLRLLGVPSSTLSSSRLAGGAPQRSREDHYTPVEALVMELLESFGLLERRRQKAATLSGGEQRRLELARLFASEPPLLLLDEPFRGLDRTAAAGLSARLRQHCARGGAVLLADHHLDQVMSLCHRIYLLFEGRIVFEGSSQDAAAWIGMRGDSSALPPEAQFRGVRFGTNSPYQTLVLN
jgi:lipopolysaccharide export system ATP-binding protein